eukprot:Colp12_sorted_trinity150504_noHs@33986
MEAQWESLYARLKKDIQDTRKSGKKCTETDLNRYEDRFNKLDQSLQIIRASPMEYEVSSAEVARRTVICEHLKRQLTTLSPNDSTPRNSTSSVASGAVSPQTRAPITLMHESMTNNPLQSERELIRRQEMVMRQQDLALGDIEKGVGRLKNQAMEIGEEVKVQNAVLDNLDTHVDVATEGLKEETKHAEEVRVKGQVCYMY